MASSFNNDSSVSTNNLIRVESLNSVNKVPSEKVLNFSGDTIKNKEIKINVVEYSIPKEFTIIPCQMKSSIPNLPIYEKK